MVAISALLNAVEPLWDFLKDVDPMDLVKFLVFYYRLPKGQSGGKRILKTKETRVIQDLKNGTVTEEVIEHYK